MTTEMVRSKLDLRTHYLGLELKHPIVAAASPLSYTLRGIGELADAGAAAVVMHSLFEEQINYDSKVVDQLLSHSMQRFPETLDYLESQAFNADPEAYLELIREAKASTDIPIIGSLNGVSPGGWTRYAKYIQDAGADALELNMYYLATDLHLAGVEVERLYLDVVRDVREVITIPLAVKIGPYFSSVAHMANRFKHAGVDGLVMFNRFYQPDFDVETLEVFPQLVLSQAFEVRLPLTWIGLLYGRLGLDFALSSGVHSHVEVLKAMMAGAKVAMLASSLLRYGAQHIHEILTNVQAWMETYGYESIRQMQGGMSQLKAKNPEAFERGNYIRMLQSWYADPQKYG